MFRKLTATTICAVLMGTPVLAAPSNDIAANNAAATALSNASSFSGHHHRIVVKKSTQGDREVNALNALEAAGYRQFTDLHARGRDFVATAQKAGKSYDVTIEPSGTIHATNA